MHLFSLGIALLAALALLGIGSGFLFNPRAMTSSFGLPQPAVDANTTWWLRLKGVRDTAAGVLILAFMVMDGRWGLGLVLLAEALVPIGDMSTVLLAKGSPRIALGVHGATAALMLVGAIPLLRGS